MFLLSDVGDLLTKSQTGLEDWPKVANLEPREGFLAAALGHFLALF